MGPPPSQSSPRERLRTSSLNKCCCPHRTDPHDLKVNTKQQQALSKIAAFKMALNYSGSEDTALHPHPPSSRGSREQGSLAHGDISGASKTLYPSNQPSLSSSRWHPGAKPCNVTCLRHFRDKVVTYSGLDATTLFSFPEL